MKNEYIELVKKWQAGEYFSDEELRANADAAYAAYADVDVDADADSYAAADAADAARAASDAARADAYGADYWVKRYEEETNEK